MVITYIHTHTPVVVLKGGIWARAYAPERVAGDRSEFDPRPIQHWLSCRIEAKSNTALLTDTNNTNTNTNTNTDTTLHKITPGTAH